MNRRSVVGAMVMAAMLVCTQAVFAAPAAVYTPVNAMYASGKMVKFTLRNDSNAPMKVKVGDAEMTLKPGEPVDVKLAVGQQIINEEATATNKAGAVLATAIAELNGATIAIR